MDDEVAELFLMEEEPSPSVLKAAIRRATIACTFVPVTMGSAFKNKGVQALLDSVIKYLPSPAEKKNVALDIKDAEKEVEVFADDSKPLVALAFKLEETKFGQLSYMRIYQGTLKKSGYIHNAKTGKKFKVPRLVRMHSDDMEEIDHAGSGEVVAMFGVDCSSMDSFTDGTHNLAMTSMYVPEPVMSIMITPAKTSNLNNFGKAMAKFSKEVSGCRWRREERRGEERRESGMETRKRNGEETIRDEAKAGGEFWKFGRPGNISMGFVLSFRPSCLFPPPFLFPLFFFLNFINTLPPSPPLSLSAVLLSLCLCCL